MSTPLDYQVASQTDLNNAIAEIEQTGGPDAYTITFTQDITEGDGDQPAGIDAIQLPTGASLTIDGANHTLNGKGVDGGLAVTSGKVTIESLTIEDTVAQGAAGTGSGGGGAGLGGGLFVGAAATVTARSLSFKTDAAMGGAGGTGGGGGEGGDSSLIFAPSLGVAGQDGDDGDQGDLGEDGTDGSAGSQGGLTQPGGSGGSGGSGGDGEYHEDSEGGDGGDGGNGAVGGAGGLGGKGGDGGDGGTGGAGAAGGSTPLQFTRSHTHSFSATFTLSRTTISGGSNGFDAGNGGKGGDGAAGGDGGDYAGGGAGGNGGDGGGKSGIEAAVAFRTLDETPQSDPTQQGGSGSIGDEHTDYDGGANTASNTATTYPDSAGFDAGNGGDGADGGNGANGGDGGFGAGGGGGGNGGAGGDGGMGGYGGPGADSGTRDYSQVHNQPTPGNATDGGSGGNGGNGGDGGDGGDGGAGGFGGGGGGGGGAGAAGAAGAAGPGGPGGSAFETADHATTPGPNLSAEDGTRGSTGSTGSTGSVGKTGSGKSGGFGAGAGTDAGKGGGGLGAGGDIFVQEGGKLILDGGLLTAGTVAGGADPNNASKGFGNGLFIQGTETVTLSADSGKTLTVSGVIADQPGSISGATGSGRLEISGTGTVDLAAANTFKGGIKLDSGTLVLAHAGAAGSGPITFSSATDPTLVFSAADAPTNPLDDFGPNDEIEITGFEATGHSYTNGILTLEGAGGPVVLHVPGHADTDFAVVPDLIDDETLITSAVACFGTGTLIETARGPVPVEALAIGDIVVTVSGGHRPVTWTGHRCLDITRHPDPKAVWPVRISAGAFGENLPRRDLWMSPGHNVFVEGVLMPVRVLVNGATIVREPVDTVTYWHVELDSHDVILAEGLPAESYLDTGNRTAFENGGAFLEMHPDFEPKHWAETCAPIVKAGPEVEAAKAALLTRAADLGRVTTALHDLHVVADGHRFEPINLGNRRFAFALPAGCKAVAIVSRTFVPSHMKPDSTDTRVLGVAVGRLQIDGEDIDLSGPLAEGWHAPEQRLEHVRRWTTGSAALPAGAQLVIVDLVGDGRYWIERKDNVVALRA